MQRPIFRFPLLLLVAVLPLALGACRVFHKKEAAPTAEAPKTGAKKDGTPAATTEGGAAGAADAQKPGEVAEQKKETTGTPEPSTPTVDPLKSEELKNLPKGEPEFIVASRTAGATDKMTVTGRDGLIFSTAELRALGAGPVAASTPHQTIVAQVAGYAAALKAAGIEFVLAPVPPKAVVYPDYVSAATKLKDRRYDSSLEALYADLEKVGVRVVDMTKSLRSDRFDRQGGSFPRAGVVWSPPAAASTAKAIFKDLKRTDAAKTLVRDKTIVSRKAGVAQDGEVFAAESVGRLEGSAVVPAAVGKEGPPILVVGDANAGAYRQNGQTASLADQLSLAFGVPAETRSDGVAGWKQAPAKFSPKKAGATKIVVWCFSAADFLGTPAAPTKATFKPFRHGSGAPASPPRSTAPGPSLKLRDDPGLDVRPQ